MRTVAIVLTVLMLTVPLSGCFSDEEQVFIEEESDFPDEIPLTTWYHYSGGIDAMDAVAVSNANITVNLSGDNAPYLAVGSYYGIGMSTFEPTIGITSMDNIYTVSYTHLRAHETR